MRSYNDTASRPRPKGAIGAVIDRGLRAPRTLPRDPDKREALVEAGERPDRLGPAASPVDESRTSLR